MPPADLLDRRRFSLWCRALYAEKVFTNSEWLLLARKLFAKEFERCGEDVESLGRLVANIPQSVSVFETVRESFERGLLRVDRRVLEAVARELRRINPKPPIPTPNMETLLARIAAARVQVVGKDEDGNDIQEIVGLSNREEIELATGVFPEEGGAGEAAKKLLARYYGLRDRSFPRVVVKTVEDEHAGRTGEFFEDSVPAADAPRLILAEKDCEPLKNTGRKVYPGRSIFFRG